MINFKQIYGELFSGGTYCPTPCERDIYANDAFKGILKDNKITSIIEVGAGLGHIAKSIHTIDPAIQLTCADLGNFHNLNYVTHIDCDLTIQEDLGKILRHSYDVVFCLDCLEHIPEENLEDILLTFKQIGTWVIISVPSTQSRAGGHDLHLNVKLKDWWDAALKSHFTIVNSTVQHGFLFHYTLKSNK